MNNQRPSSLAAAVVAGTLAATGAGAALAADFTDWAQVVSSAPKIERIASPRQECWTEPVTTNEVRRETSPSSPLGAIVGGIAGGVLGNQIGGGRGRDVATAAGAVTGAVIGNNIDNRDRSSATYVTPVTRDVQRCRTVEDYREVIRGYDVVYRYNGHDVPVHLPYDPGPRVLVSVSLAPEASVPPPRRH